MSRPPLKVVSESDEKSPSDFDSAIESAVKRAKAAGAVTFLLTFQTADEAPTSIGFPNALSVREGLSLAAMNAIHFPGGRETFEEDV